MIFHWRELLNLRNKPNLKSLKLEGNPVCEQNIIEVLKRFVPTDADLEVGRGRILVKFTEEDLNYFRKTKEEKTLEVKQLEMKVNITHYISNILKSRKSGLEQQI